MPRTLEAPQGDPLIRRLAWEEVPKLYRGNRGTLITDPAKTATIWGEDGEAFDKRLFTAVIGAWVAKPVALRNGSTSVEWKVTDGHHRLGLVHAVGFDRVTEVMRRKDPLAEPFSLELIDATSSQMQNKKIVVPPQRLYIPPEQSFSEMPLVLDDPPDGFSTLTMPEYFKAILGPTQAHERITAPRIAVHLMQYWDELIGSSDLAQRFNTASAMLFITDRALLGQVDARSTNVLDHLDKHPEITFFPGSTEDDQHRIRGALHSMVSTLEGAGIPQTRALDVTFNLILTHPDTVGGRDAARDQLASILAVREANRTNEPPTIKRTHLDVARSLQWAAARNGGNDPTPKEILALLRDKRLTIADIGDLSARDRSGRDNREREYQTILTKRSRETVTDRIQRREERETTVIEDALVKRLIDNNTIAYELGRLETYIPKAAFAIGVAENLITQLQAAGETESSPRIRALQTHINRLYRPLGTNSDILDLNAVVRGIRTGTFTVEEAPQHPQGVAARTSANPEVTAAQDAQLRKTIAATLTQQFLTEFGVADPVQQAVMRGEQTLIQAVTEVIAPQRKTAAEPDISVVVFSVDDVRKIVQLPTPIQEAVLLGDLQLGEALEIGALEPHDLQADIQEVQADTRKQTIREVLTGLGFPIQIVHRAATGQLPLSETKKHLPGQDLAVERRRIRQELEGDVESAVTDRILRIIGINEEERLHVRKGESTIAEVVKKYVMANTNEQSSEEQPSGSGTDTIQNIVALAVADILSLAPHMGMITPAHVPGSDVQAAADTLTALGKRLRQK